MGMLVGMDTACLLTRVQVPIVHVGSMGVSQHKCLHTPLRWLFGHVLDETEPALESNHAFINANFL